MQETTKCPEPDGQEFCDFTTKGNGEPITNHEVMMIETGYCPWCGAEE